VSEADFAAAVDRMTAYVSAEETKAALVEPLRDKRAQNAHNQRA